MGGRLIHEVDLYTSKYGNYKLSWLIGKMSLCGQVDKRVNSRSRGRGSSSSSDE